MSSARDPQALIRHTAFRVDPAQGSLRREGGERIALLAHEGIHALHAALIEEFSETAVDCLYRAGYEWGLQEMLARHQQLREELGGPGFDLWQMDGKFVLDAWWAPLAEAGWGGCTFDCSRTARGLVQVDVRASAVASVLRPAEEPVCHLYAGLFAAAVSFFDRVERHAAELQCAAVQGDVCRFLVGSGPDVDAAESWRQQGASLEEILQRLR